MLTHLHIRNFAIIDTSELELGSGMTALTGETGAGKSILLDALGLVLGARASSDSIQQGQKRADITASFSIEDHPEVAQWLKANELDADGECIVRRTLTSNGKSRASINDIPVSVQTQADLGRQLVSIHGQHAHQSLGKSAEQRRLLDRVAGGAQLGKVSAAFEAWKQSHDKLEQFEADALALASPAISRSIKPLGELTAMDEQLREALDLVESASIQVAESLQSVQRCLGSLEHDDARLQWLDQKLGALHRLSKKHQCELGDLAQIEDSLRNELTELTDPDTNSETLAKQCEALLDIYTGEAAKLSRHRKKHAKALSKTITDAMQELAMTGGTFQIDVKNQKSEPSPYGQDTVTFMVSPNTGVAPAPLGKVASGGELSRISLCMQLATLDTREVPTLVFDEVDSGVGGAVAETVGQLLRRVGSRSQVLCVTHLPQVAAQAHNHLKVSKDVQDGKTRTQVNTLDQKQTRDEIARMLGGSKITRKSQQHAQEMLELAAAEP